MATHNTFSMKQHRIKLIFFGFQLNISFLKICNHKRSSQLNRMMKYKLHLKLKMYIAHIETTQPKEPQHSSWRNWFFVTTTTGFATWRQFCCIACNTENKLCTTKLYITPMMQQGRAFPSCPAAANQVWTTCSTVTSFDNFLHTKTHSSSRSFRFGVLSHLCSSKQFVLADFGRVKFLWRQDMSVDFIRKVTGV